MPLPSDFKDKVLEKLRERRVRSDCELCGQNNWAFVEQAIGLPLTDLSGNVVIPGPQIPAAALVCKNCGNVRTFALRTLGLLS
ncbi:MAG: hypothetical protein KatS3mg081_0131 [Gemmatimonadales bacterium]|nr:MAG: hypothetical protein KatS3mg081_0131 [Gemmatimonadales bacterium]